jgi:hypothetical protein
MFRCLCFDVSATRGQFIMFQQHAISFIAAARKRFGFALKLLQIDVTVVQTRLAAAGVPVPACAGFKPM